MFPHLVVIRPTCLSAVAQLRALDGLAGGGRVRLAGVGQPGGRLWPVGLGWLFARQRIRPIRRFTQAAAVFAGCVGLDDLRVSRAGHGRLARPGRCQFRKLDVSG